MEHGRHVPSASYLQWRDASVIVRPFIAEATRSRKVSGLSDSVCSVMQCKREVHTRARGEATVGNSA